ncbi:major facilitator superfamily domain-containing protein [Dipodascopsis uninucleata]
MPEENSKTIVETAAEIGFAELNKTLFDDDPNFKPNVVARAFGFFWDSFKKPPKERAYFLKLDAGILFYALLSYGLKSMCLTNISNAYVSGMSDDLKLYSQQLNLFTTFFQIGYLVGAIPSQMIISKFRPSIWIPANELCWSAIVMALAAAKTSRTIYGLRFLIGLFESCSFPGFAYMLGCWYGPGELAKRLGTFELAGYAANMVSGNIEASIYATLNGACGIAGWRWMFIINGATGFPIALIGFFSIPDFPHNTRVMWLSAREKEISHVRMRSMGRADPKQLTPKRLFAILFASFRIWPPLISYVMVNISSTQSYFTLWLKSQTKYSIETVNRIPTAGYASGIVMGLTSSILSDYFRIRWPFLLFNITIRFTGSLLLAIWNLPDSVIFFANFCGFFGEPCCFSLLLSWASEVFQDNAEIRGLIAASGTTISGAISTWLPLLIFPTPEAPHYKYGYKFTTAFDGVDCICVFVFLYCTMRERRQKDMVLNEYNLYVPRSELRIQQDRIEEVYSPDVDLAYEKGKTII